MTPGTAGSPTVVTCDSSSVQISRVGQGANANYANVTVNNNGQIVVPNDNSISLGNNANIVVNSGGLVQTTGSGGNGQYGDGPNTIDVNNTSSILVNAGASVITTNPQCTSEAIKSFGSGNIITNYGLIQGGASTAIWFQNVNTTGSSPRNVVDNFGVIQVVRIGAATYDPTANVIGASHAVGIDFINETGARINGNLIFGNGNDTITLNPGSVITGNMDGGGGNNLITLNASATSAGSMPGDVKNFQTMNKTGAGTWTLTGAVGNNGGATPLAVTVIGGTLELTGNNTNFNGTVLIDPDGTLKARAQSLPNPTSGQGVITDNGVLLINQVAPNAISVQRRDLCRHGGRHRRADQDRHRNPDSRRRQHLFGRNEIQSGRNRRRRRHGAWRRQRPVELQWRRLAVAEQLQSLAKPHDCPQRPQ